MSTQGLRHLALFLSVLFSWLVVPIASSSSLETHERTSRGLDLEVAAELSTARIWATSDSPPPIEDMVVLCCSSNNQCVWCDMVVAVEQRLQTEVFYLTSPRLCIGYIDETIHHLAHLLDLRSRAIDWVAWVICSFKGKKFITYTLWLHSGSFPLCPADIQSLMTVKQYA